jgi:hypothetical protein
MSLVQLDYPLENTSGNFTEIRFTASFQVLFKGREIPPAEDFIIKPWGTIQA